MTGLFGNFFLCGSCMRIKRKNSMTARRTSQRHRRSSRGNSNHGNSNHGNSNHGNSNHGNSNHGNSNHGSCNYGYLHDADHGNRYNFDKNGLGGSSVPSKPKAVLTSTAGSSNNGRRTAPSPIPGPSSGSGSQHNHHHQQHAGYVQSLPVAPAATDSLEHREVAALRKEVVGLRQELAKCRETMSGMTEREKLLRDRLSDQVQKQFEKTSGKFEDLSLGENRPTQLLRRFGNLYSQVRLDAYDALDDLPDMMDFDDLKGKLLFSVVVLAFRSAQMSVHKMKSSVRSLLCIPRPDHPDDPPADPLAQEVETSVAIYLRKSLDTYNIATNIHEVSEQVYATLFDYPSLRACEGLRVYIEECVRLAWAVTVQNPPLVLEYERRAFSADTHTRFHSSDPASTAIVTVLWPALLEGESGPCVHKGVVIT